MRWRDSRCARTAALCRKAGCGTRHSSGDMRQLTRGQDSACSVATACCSVCARVKVAGGWHRLLSARARARAHLPRSCLVAHALQLRACWPVCLAAARAHLHRRHGVCDLHGQRDELSICRQKRRKQGNSETVGMPGWEPCAGQVAWWVAQEVQAAPRIAWVRLQDAPPQPTPAPQPLPTQAAQPAHSRGR